MEGDIVLVPAVLTGRLPNLPKIGPKPKEHQTIGGLCLLCQQQFAPGCYTTVVPLGPGMDPDARKAARTEKQPYHGIGMEIHWACATGEPDEPEVGSTIAIAQKLPPSL